MTRFVLSLLGPVALLLGMGSLFAGCCRERTVRVTESATYYEVVASYPAASYPQLASAAKASLADLPTGAIAPLVQVAPGQLRVALVKHTTPPATTRRLRQFAHTITTLLTTPQP